MKKIKLVDNTEITFEELALSDSNGIPHVMTLLQEKRLNPEDVPEELLSLKNNSSISVLNVCIERLKEPVPDNDGQIVPRALFLANKHGCGLPLHFRKVKEILRIARENGWSVAHEMASQNLLPESMMTEEILSLTNDTGYAVAYAAAWHDSLPGWAKRRKDILLLGNGQGDYVVHELARNGKLPVEMMTPDILHLENKNGITVFSAIVFGKHLSPEILMLPWNKKIRIFKYLSSAEFLNQNLSQQTIKYVKEQLAVFEALMWKKSFSTLSVIGHDHEDLER